METFSIEDRLPEIGGDRLSREREFITDLSALDKGRLAVLGRNAGNTLADARGITWFYGLLSRYSGNRSDEAHFLVATLYAADKSALDCRHPLNGDLGATLRALKVCSGPSIAVANSLDRRFNILMDSDFDPYTGGELGYRLRQMTKLVISKSYPSVRINWPQLLSDVKRWNLETKSVQKRWARSYYSGLFQVEDNAMQ